MIVWILQVREPDRMLDTLVPLGTELPDYLEFFTRCKEAKVSLPEDFVHNYYRPCILALKREMAKPMKPEEKTWYHCAFNCEGRIMLIQGLTENAYK